MNKLKAIFWGGYIISIISMIIFLGKPEFRHLIFPIITVAMILGIERFFITKMEYYRALLLFMIFYLSVTWIAMHGNMMVPLQIKDYIIFESFVCFLAISILVSSNIVNNLKFRLLVSSFLVLVTSVPVLLIWAYYFSSHAFLTVESCMAILQTNPSEAWQYVNDHSSMVGVIGVAVVLAGGASVLRGIQTSAIKKLTPKWQFVLCLLLLVDLLLIYRTRENIIGNLIYDTRVYASQYESYKKNREERMENLSSLPDLANKGNPGIYVLVIGESETRDRMSLYGYDRDTTPFLNSIKEAENVIVFDKAWSCANDTVSALTYALTNKNQYNDVDLNKAFSLVEVANAAGYNTVWISNQVQYGLADTPITAIASEAKQQIWLRDKVGHMKDGRYLDVPDYYDERVVPSIDELEVSDKMLIVIHIMGSHNSYKVRYPDKFAKFSGDDSDEYDNSVLYTDYVLENILDKVNEMPTFKGLVYFSDHGEGIDDHVGHDNNNFTYQMTRIPLFMYVSSSFMKDRHDDYVNLLHHRNSYFTNDLVFETMLGLMGIYDSNICSIDNVITTKQYNSNINRFYTSYGKRKIECDPTVKASGS